MQPIRIVLTVAGVVGAFVVACTTTEDVSSVPPGPDAGTVPPDGAPSGEEEADAGDQDAAATDAGDGGDGGGVCPIPGSFGSEACDRCLAARCCDVILECEQDTACRDLMLCTQGCLSKPDIGACMDECYVDHADGEAKFLPVDSCIAGEPPEGCVVDCS